MKFKEVADYFQQIERESSRNQITLLLAQLLDHASPDEAYIITHFALGELDAPYRSVQFGLASKSMIGIICVLLEESVSDIEMRLRSLGDLGDVVAASAWSHQSDLTVIEVYKRLEHIARISGTGSQETKALACKDLLSDLDPLSAKYVVRIIIGTLRLGFSDMTIIDALSWMLSGSKKEKSTIEHAYNICADIGLIALVAKKQGIEGLKSMNIHLGVPIRPAAAERLPSAQAIFEKLGSCIAQPKLDGFRLQIHIDATHKELLIKFFSRNLLDMSNMFPDLKKALGCINAETVIMEGEAIGHDVNTGQFLPFQETVKRKRKHGIEQAQEEFPLKVFIFDLLYLNGESVFDKTHHERRELLTHVLASCHTDVVQLIDEKKIHSAPELSEYFSQNIERGLEGLVVKRPNALYQPGKRNFNWIKLKREHEGELEDSIDCVILGYYAGRGKRAQFGIGAFLVGVYNKSADRFESVAKIGTGLSDQDWIELKKKCDKIKTTHKPVNVYIPESLTPTVLVYPEIVCEIRADEITKSPVHTAGRTEHDMGLALRFPRFMSYRTDKSAFDATTVAELKHMFKDQYHSKDH